MIEVQIKGMDELLKKLNPQILSQPLRNFFTRSLISIQSKARANAPSDTGGLLNRIDYEIDKSTIPSWGKVGIIGAQPGSNSWFQARAMEFGTGRMGDPAVSHQPEHFPPGAALDTWARRHSLPSGWAVARAIAKRGGLLPRPFLRPALQNSLAEIGGFLNRMGIEIKALWDSK